MTPDNDLIVRVRVLLDEAESNLARLKDELENVGDAAKTGSDNRVKDAQTAAQKLIEIEQKVAQETERLRNLKSTGRIKDTDYLEYAKLLEQLSNTRKQAEREFAAIGDAAAVLDGRLPSGFKKTSDAATDADAKLRKASGAFGSLKDGVAGLLSGDVSVFELADGFEELTAALGPVAGVAAGATAVIAGITVATTAAVNKAADYSEELRQLQLASGATVETNAAILQSFKSVDGSLGDAADLLNNLSQKLVESRDKGSDAAKAFAEFKIDATNIQNSGQAFDQLARAVAKAGAGLTTDQKNALSQLAGEEGQRQLVALAGRYDEVSKKVREYGLTLTDQQRNALATYKKGLGDIQLQLDGVVNQVGAAAAPAFAQFVTNLGQFVKSLDLDSKATQETIATIATGIVELVTASAKLTDLLAAASPVAEIFKIFSANVKEGSNSIQVFLGIAQDLSETIQALTSPLETLAFLLGDEITNSIPVLKEAAQAAQDRAKAQDRQRQADDAARKSEEERSKATAAAAAADRAAAEETKKKTDALKDQADAAKGANEAIAIEGEGLQQRLASQVEAGTLKQSEAARGYFDFLKSRQAELIANASSVRDAEIAAAGDSAAKRQDAENNFAQAKLKISGDLQKAEGEILKAEVVERKTALDEQLKGIDNAAKLQIASLTGTDREVAAARAEIQSKAISDQLRVLETQLANERLSGEERKTLESQVTDLKINLAQSQADAAKEAEQSRVDAAREAKAVMDELDSQERAKFAAAAEEELAQLRASGATREQIALRRAELSQQQLELEIRQREEALKSMQVYAQANGIEIEGNVDIIRAETELLQLRARQATVAQDVADAVVAAKNSEIEATERATEAENRRADSLGRTGQAAAQGLRLIGQIGGEAFGDTAESIAAAIRSIQNQIDVYRRLGFAPAQTLIDNLQAAFLKQDEILGRAAREQEARNRESAQRQADERQRILDKADQDEARAREKRDQDLGRLDERRTVALDRLNDQRSAADRKALDDRQDAYRDYLDRVADLDKREADAAVERARNRERRISEASSQARQSALDSEQSFLTERSDLDAQLADAQKRAQGGDQDAVKEVERIQANIAKTEELFGLERRREQEKSDALREAQARGASQAEIEILLEQIDASINSERDYIENRARLQANGDTARLAALEQSQARERERLAGETTRRLAQLKEDLQKEEDDRKAQRQRLADDLTERYTAIDTARNEDLAKAQKAYDDEMGQLRAQQVRILDEYKKTYDEIARIRQNALQPTGGTQPSGNDTGGSGGGPVGQPTTPGGNSISGGGGGGTGGNAGPVQRPANQPSQGGGGLPPGVTISPGGNRIITDVPAYVRFQVKNLQDKGRFDDAVAYVENQLAFYRQRMGDSDRSVRESARRDVAGLEKVLTEAKKARDNAPAPTQPPPPEETSEDRRRQRRDRQSRRNTDGENLPPPEVPTDAATAPEERPTNTPQAPPVETPPPPTTATTTLTIPPPPSATGVQPGTVLPPVLSPPTASGTVTAKPATVQSAVQRNERVEALIRQIEGDFIRPELAEEQYARFAAGMEGQVSAADLQRIREAIDKKKGIVKSTPPPVAKPTLASPPVRELDSGRILERVPSAMLSLPATSRPASVGGASASGPVQTVNDNRKLEFNILPLDKIIEGIREKLIDNGYK